MKKAKYCMYCKKKLTKSDHIEGVCNDCLE